MRFPQLEARDLEGKSVVLPAAFVGEYNVVLLAFERTQQLAVDTWIPWLEALVSRRSDVAFYEVPVIAGAWKVMRRVIDSGMAAAILTPTVLRRTMTVYGNVEKVTSPLKIPDRSAIVTLLVDRDGVVIWSTRGSFSPDAAASLNARLS